MSRTVAATAMNDASSRGHCLVMVTLLRRWPDGSQRPGKLVMVDLAGSERTGRTLAAGQVSI